MLQTYYPAKIGKIQIQFLLQKQVGRPRGELVKLLDYEIVVSEFELCFTLDKYAWERYVPPNSPVYGQIEPPWFF